MAVWPSGLPGPRALIFGAGACLVALAVLAMLFAWSGIYNVSANKGHWSITVWFLEMGLRNSVKTHAMFIEPPPLDDPELVKAGAGQFELVCAACHGSPVAPDVPVASAMLPSPPSLAEAAGEWEPAQLFWVIRNGLKYTGMPGWVAPEREDEVWAVAAFVRALPGMSAETYTELTRGNLPGESDASRNPFDLGATESVRSCARCHGDAGSAPVSHLVPRLAGQSRAYLERALDEYARGERPSGIMQPIAAALTADRRARLAEHYAGLDRPAEAGAPADPALVSGGREIAVSGVSAAGVPPCLACHGKGRHPLFPSLAGQSSKYIASQLALWRSGLRTETTPGAIMAPIARRLDESTIEAVAAYFESLKRDDVAQVPGAGREARR